ncbi:protease inhibitor [Escherichia phage vB_EcoM_ESCO47]|nr:protease inhibitor [Escherichia phage vB_EcoM_ESCO47]
MNISETRGKWFKIVKEDEELQAKFPELKKGTIIKVIGISTTADLSGGIVEVMLSTGEKLCINDRDIGFWCFWESDSIDELEEIDQVVRDSELLGEFEGERISYALAKLAAQENNDGYEGNLMQAAAEYIEYLERRLS